MTSVQICPTLFTVHYFFVRSLKSSDLRYWQPSWTSVKTTQRAGYGLGGSEENIFLAFLLACVLNPNARPLGTYETKIAVHTGNRLTKKQGTVNVQSRYDLKQHYPRSIAPFNIISMEDFISWLYHFIDPLYLLVVLLVQFIRWLLFHTHCLYRGLSASVSQDNMRVCWLWFIYS